MLICPLRRARNRALPDVEPRVTLRRRHFWFEAMFHFPLRGDFFLRCPIPDPKPG